MLQCYKCSKTPKMPEWLKGWLVQNADYPDRPLVLTCPNCRKEDTCTNEA